MAQNVDDYIYYGVMLPVRHPIEEIKEIWLGDKLSTHVDFSDVELSEYLSYLTGQYNTVGGLNPSFSKASSNLNLVANLLDADLSTLWRNSAADNIPCYVEYRYSTPIRPTSFTLERAKAVPDDNTSPLDFVLMGSNDNGQSWVDLATEVNTLISDNTGAYNFPVTTTTFYERLRLRITKTNGSDFVRLNEFVVAGVVQGSSSSGGDVDYEITLDGNVENFTHTAVPGDTSESIRDSIYNKIIAHGYSQIEVEKIDNVISTNNSDTYEFGLIIKRIQGSSVDWDFDLIVSNIESQTGLEITTTKTKGHPQTRTYHRIITELGDQTSANATLVSELDRNDIPQKWDSSCILSSVPHINIRWETDFVRNEIGGVPPVTIVLKGKNNLYDVRDGNLKYSTNPAIVERDYLASDVGFGASASELPDDVWIAAANVCDEQVVIDALGNEQDRYAYNGTYDLNQQPGDVLSYFSDTMQAPTLWHSGQWKIKPAAWYLPVTHLTQDDFTGSFTKQGRTSIQNRFSEVVGTYVEPKQSWGQHDYPSVSVDDGLANKTANIDFTNEIDPIRAQRLAQIYLLTNTLSSVSNFSLKYLDENDFTAGDFITISIDFMGWDKKIFYVLDRSYNIDGTSQIAIKPADEKMYEWDYTQAQTIDEIETKPIFRIREDIIEEI